MKRRVAWAFACVLAACAVVTAWGRPASAQLSNDSVKIGVATDMASLYSDINGPGAVAAVEMAIGEFGGTVLGKKIELVSGDIQNKTSGKVSVRLTTRGATGYVIADAVRFLPGDEETIANIQASSRTPAATSTTKKTRTSVSSTVIV